MAIYKTAADRYGVDWRDEFGRRHRKQVGTLAQAEAIQANLRVTTAEAKLFHPRTATLSLIEAFELYLTQIPTRETTKKTERAHMQAIAKALPNHMLTDLSTQDLLAWAERAKETYGHNSRAQFIGLLKRFFRWAEEANLCPNLAAPLRPPRRVLGKSHILSYEEEAKILAAIHTPRLTLRVLLGLDAGLGISDASQLRRNQCDVISGLISHIRHKTQAAVKIPMTARLRNLINDDFGQLAPQALLTTGKQLRAPSDFLRDLRQRAEVEFNFHDLRRTFATRLAETETNPIVITALLGHTTPWQVQLAYVKPTEQLLRAAIERMEQRNPNCQEHLSDPENEKEQPCNTSSPPSPPSCSSATSSERPSDEFTVKQCWHCTGKKTCPCIACEPNAGRCVVCDPNRKPIDEAKKKR